MLGIILFNHSFFISHRRLSTYADFFKPKQTLADILPCTDTNIYPKHLDIYMHILTYIHTYVHTYIYTHTPLITVLFHNSIGIKQ